MTSIFNKHFNCSRRQPVTFNDCWVVQSRSRWYICAQESPYMLHPSWLTWCKKSISLAVGIYHIEKEPTENDTASIYKLQWNYNGILLSQILVLNTMFLYMHTAFRDELLGMGVALPSCPQLCSNTNSHRPRVAFPSSPQLCSNSTDSEHGEVDGEPMEMKPKLVWSSPSVWLSKPSTNLVHFLQYWSTAIHQLIKIYETPLLSVSFQGNHVSLYCKERTVHIQKGTENYQHLPRKHKINRRTRKIRTFTKTLKSDSNHPNNSSDLYITISLV